MGGGEATRVEPCSHKRLTSSARLGPTLRSSAGWLTEQQAMELGGPLRRIAVFGAGARMAWEAQDINGRPRQVSDAAQRTESGRSGREDRIYSGLGPRERTRSVCKICGWAPCLGRGVPEAREG